MIREPIHKIEPLYPDVLGAITGGKRINLDKLQVALGIHPTRAYINQPIEVIVIFQNMVDQMMQIKVGVQVPTSDRRNEPVVIDLAKKTIGLGLRPGEVGVLHIPIAPLPPTQPGTGFPVRLAVRYRTAEEGRAIRPITGGAPPSVLSVSNFKLQALKEVQYEAHTWNESSDILTTYFDIAPKRIPPMNEDLEPRYESLWTLEEAGQQERELIQSRIPMALRVASSLTKSVVYQPMLQTVEERFAERGMPLHPGETQAIAKMITYTLDEGLELEHAFPLQESRWFQTLVQVIAHDEALVDMKKGQLAVQYLFEPALYDAVLLGFATVQPKVREHLGDKREQANFAQRLMLWYAGQGAPDPSYIYLPLAMGGVVINQMVSTRDDNPWYLIDDLRQAIRGRIRMGVNAEGMTLFQIMTDLLNEAEDSLRRARVPRP
jgi:hypothetical protein